MKAVYGPVPSWRLGRSLGIDPLCVKEKICSFDCTYCQLGRTVHKTRERKVFVSEERLRNDLKSFEKVEADFITFSGSGEPMLAQNLGELIDVVKEFSDLPVAVLTNSCLFMVEEVREDLKKADLVVAKLDAPNEEVFQKINNSVESVTLEDVINGIKAFRSGYDKKLALQIMFIGENKEYAADIAEIAREISPDEVQINTPLRKCPVEPLGKDEIKKIKEYFSGLNAVTVYESARPAIELQKKEEIMARRGEWQ